MIFCLQIFLIAAFVFFYNHPALAKEIKYSLGPTCKNNQILCSDPHEIPVCLTLNPKAKIERVFVDSGKERDKYSPTCGIFPNTSLPGCIDSESGAIAKDTYIECIEFAKCEIDKDSNKHLVSCSDGKIPKCLGSDSLPDCSLQMPCNDSSIPVCDYTWQASN